MSERGARRDVGAPFYAPPRRKTSAEIISEARAAIYGEMCSASSGAGSGAGAGGALRPLRTRRPFTPREPQRTLFTERTLKKDTRPPSAFDLKSLSLSENNDDALAVAMGGRVASLDEESLTEALMEAQSSKKKLAIRSQHRSFQDRSSDGWGGFPKLPHLSGRSKPLHRRNAQATAEEAKVNKTEWDLSQAISITRPLGNGDSHISSDINMSKSLSQDSNTKKKQFAGFKSVSHDAASGNGNQPLGDIAVRHLAVQLPNTSADNYESMSLLDLSEALSQRSRDVNRTMYLMEALMKTLEKTSPPSSLRDMVLRSLYTHIDSEDERVLVIIARAMFTLRVTGKHLAAACKLVFKIARNDKNDHFFKNTNLLELVVEGCGRAEPVSEGECCVYGAGALRFLALEPALRARALAAGALHLAALHLKILNNAKAENPRGVSEQSTHALYQLTGALRNLAGAGERDAKQFVSSGALAELLAALTYHTDRDVLTNVARCLSVLSAEESCCSWLCGAGRGGAGALVRALAACSPRAPLAVRLAYTLGNMAASDDQARINIYNEEGAVDVFLTILESYTNRSEYEPRDLESESDLHLIGTDLGGSDGSNEDVLIKTVRVVANLCLAERAGRGLASTHADRCIKALLACLELAEKSCGNLDMCEEERVRWSERREELATAALAALNNITFYREPAASTDPPDHQDPLDETLDNICKATCRWLGRSGSGSGSSPGSKLGSGSAPGPAGCEAVRALGNVSRTPRAAQLLVLEGALDALLPYLQHGEASVRCAAAGVLVNVCGAGVDTTRAAEIASRALYEAATRMRTDRTEGNASGALLARALWNAHAHAPLDAAHAHYAATALAIFIDDESVFAACEASKTGDRRASDPALFKNHVKFNIDNNNYPDEIDYNLKSRAFVRALSVDRVLESSDEDADRTACSGEDLGFEEGDITGEDDCDCGPCVRLAAWEELVGVAIPLLEKLKPPRADASVGTD